MICVIIHDYNYEYIYIIILYLIIGIYILYRLAACRVGLRLFFFFAWGTRAVGQSERLRDENVFL